MCVLQLASQTVGVLGQFDALLLRLLQHGGHVVQLRLTEEQDKWDYDPKHN